jgi:hypothetical protein
MIPLCSYVEHPSHADPDLLLQEVGKEYEPELR